MKIPKSQKPLYEQTSIFLFAMARLEYALKATGYVKNDGEAEWGRFAQTSSPLFDTPSEKLDEATTYLLANPPQKIKARGGVLLWEEARPPIAMPTGELVLLYLRRLRGTCFQGGEGVEVPANHKALLKCGTRVIQELLKGIPDLKAAFYS